MFYSGLIFLIISISYPVFSIEPVDKRKDSVGNIIFLRGKEVSVYTENKKLKLDAKDIPVSVSSGDEIEVGPESDCEIVMYNKDSLYLGPESLLQISWYSNDVSTAWLKYGVIMYRGEVPVAIKANDFSATTTGGDFVFRYKRKTSEFVLLNIGSQIQFKHGDIKASYALDTNKYVKAVAFSGKRTIGSLKQDAVDKLYKLLKTTYKPEGKVENNKNIPGEESDKAKLVPAEEAN
ncbi:MAG: hypothetical protein V1647_06440, partial [Pseudomonadota bacterium]